MQTLAERLREAEASSLPWDHALESYHKVERPKAQLRSVTTFMRASLLPRMLGRVPEGALARELGPRLQAQIENPNWTDGAVPRVNIAFAATLLCTDGWTLPASCSSGLEHCILGAVDGEPVWLSVERGLTGIFHGIDSPWRDEASASSPFEPGRSQGADLRGRMAYLGQAHARGAGSAAVEPTLNSLIDLFDSLAMAGSIRMQTLTLFGIVAGHCIGSVPRTEVLSWWGEQLRVRTGA